MIWKTCELIGRTQKDKDALNNPTYEKTVICTFMGRLSPWSAEEVSSLGRDYTSTHRKLLTRATVPEIKGYFVWSPFNLQSGVAKDYGCTSIVLDGVEYQIDDITDFAPRCRMLYISAYKQ